jgi:hypothetical protein
MAVGATRPPNRNARETFVNKIGVRGVNVNLLKLKTNRYELRRVSCPRLRAMKEILLLSGPIFQSISL